MIGFGSGRLRLQLSQRKLWDPAFLCNFSGTQRSKLSRPTIPMNISINQATLADLETLLEMMRHLQLDDPWSEPFHEPTLRENLAELIRNPIYGVAYIAREGVTR